MPSELEAILEGGETEAAQLMGYLWDVEDIDLVLAQLARRKYITKELHEQIRSKLRNLSNPMRRALSKVQVHNEQTMSAIDPGAVIQFEERRKRKVDSR